MYMYMRLNKRKLNHTEIYWKYTEEYNMLLINNNNNNAH